MNQRNATTRLVSRAGFLTGAIAMSTAVWAFSPTAEIRATRPQHQLKGTMSSNTSLGGLRRCVPASKRCPEKVS